LLELLVWGLYIGFPFLYSPPVWMSFWSSSVSVSMLVRVMGVACTTVGLVAAFGTMFWFGLLRALGLQVEGLQQNGPYRVTRNPQLVAGTLMVVGTVILWPSWYAVGWMMLCGIVGHLMVMTEEEHLSEVYGEEYTSYCARVPRYLVWRRGKTS
jgi:protein-S-isoprenylcysteine O-methyltransferase Ste14